MRLDRPLLASFLTAMLLTVGCAGPGAEELASAQALTLSPGTNASTHFVLDEADLPEDLDAGDVTVDAPADGLNASVAHVVEDEGTLAGWITVSAASDVAEGERTVDVSLGGEERAVPVTVAEAEDPLQEGEVGHLRLTARTLGGDLVVTNDENVSQAPFPRTAVFQEQGTEPIELQISERSQLPPALLDALAGADVGHSLTVKVPAFFGPETTEQTQARETEVPRESTAPTELTLPTQRAQRFLSPNTQQGDEVRVPATDDGQPVPYTVEEASRQQVQFSLALDEGETFTLHEPWPGAANVTNVTDEQATIHEDPNATEGETITWIEPWGDVTEVTSITEDAIVLRHSPSEGLTYEQTDPATEQTIETEIVEVSADEIVAEQTNPHPLAGDAIVFDVTVADRGQAQASPGPQR